MPTPQTLSEDLSTMSKKLEDYLLDDELYKTVTVSTERGERLIKMTLGGMMERLRELQQRDPDNPVLEPAEEALQRMRTNQSERYYKRLAREAKSYAGSWGWFLQECWDNTTRCDEDYASEVPLRLRLDLLLQEGGTRSEMDEVRQQVEDLDRRLRKIWQPSDNPVVKGAEGYDRSTYWWLFGEPKPTRK